MSLILIDTNDPHVDKHINDILVNEGHAVFQPDEQTPGVLEQNQSQVSWRNVVQNSVGKMNNQSRSSIMGYVLKKGLLVRKKGLLVLKKDYWC